MDTKLITFIHLVETKSFTKAAQVLHLTQPAVSQQIKQLEQNYHTSFLKRQQKGFTLTASGKAMYSYAKIQQHNEELFMKQIYSLTSSIVIGSTLSIADYYLADVLASTLQENKNGKIVVDNTSALIQKMMDGEVDCAFVEGKFDSQLFDFHQFLEENFIPVVRANHPLNKPKVSLQELFEYPLYLREKGSGTRSIFETYLGQSIYTLSSFQQIVEIESMTLIKQFLLNSNGITFLYERVVKEELKKGSIVKLQLPDFPLRSTMYFIYLKSNLEKDRFDSMFQEIMKNTNVTF